MIWESNALLNRRCRAGVGVKVETLLPQKGIHVWTTKLKFLKLNMEVVFSLYQTVTRLRDSKEAPRSSSVTTVSAEAVLTTCPTKPWAAWLPPIPWNFPEPTLSSETSPAQ